MIRVHWLPLVLAAALSACEDSSGPSAPPPLAGKVVFASLRSGSWGLWYANPDGSKATRIPLPAPLVPQDLDVSPDGERVVFSADNQVWVVDWDGAHLRSLSGAFQVNRFPRWAPAGDVVVFTSTRAGPSDLWVVNVDGTPTPGRLTNETQGASRPVWSQAGDRIVYSCIRNGDIEVCAVDLETGATERVTAYPGADEPLDWSPDGSGILVWGTHTIGGALTAGYYIVDPSTGLVSLLSGAIGLGPRARYAPDGARIVAERLEADLTSRLYFLPALGGDPSIAFDDDATDAHPAWGPPP